MTTLLFRRTLRLPKIVMFVIVLAIVVIPTQHALRNHNKADVEAVRECVGKNPTISFVLDNIKRYLIICKLSDGRWGLQVAELAGGVFTEVTAFVPKDGSIDRVIKYLLGNDMQVWAAAVRYIALHR